jgi:hypothetical protein
MSTSTVPNPIRIAVATTVLAVLAVGGAVGLRELGQSDRTTIREAPTSHLKVGIHDFESGPTTSGGKVMVGP